VVDTQTDVDAGVDVRSPPLLAANARDVAVEPPPPESIVHRVKRGDTLFSLARLYRTTVASLKRWNDLRSNRILVGQRLTVRTGQATIATY
jgi:LysM repeat protein